MSRLSVGSIVVFPMNFLVLIDSRVIKSRRPSPTQRPKNSLQHGVTKASQTD